MHNEFVDNLNIVKAVNKRYPKTVIICLVEALLDVVKIYLPLFIFAPLLQAIISLELNKIAIWGLVYFFSIFITNILSHFMQERRIVYCRIINEQSINALYMKIGKLPYEKYRNREIKLKYDAALENIYYEFDYSDMIEQEVNILKSILTICLSLSLTVTLLLSKSPANTIFGKLSSPTISCAAYAILTLFLIFTNSWRSKEKIKLQRKLLSKHAATESKLMYLQNGIIFQFKNYLSYALFNMKRMLTTRFDENRSENVDFFMQYRDISINISNGYNISSGISTLFSFILTTIKIISGAVPTAMLVTYSQGMLKTHDAIFDISSSCGKIKQAIQYFINIETVMQLDEEAALQEKNINLHPCCIRFEHVFYRYPHSEVYAIKDLSFELTADKTYVLVGENGSGKTTLLLLLLRFISPESGNIYINDINIEEIDIHAYRNLFSCMFQEGAVYPISIIENITFSKHVNLDTAIKSLKKAGASEEFLNEEFLTSYHEERNLSGGEKQKIVAARAFSRKAKIYIFDEPASALDAISEDRLYKELLKLAEGHFIIFVSHRMSSCQLCDNIIVLSQGELAEQGNHSTLINMRGLYYSLWDAQAKVYSTADNK